MIVCVCKRVSERKIRELIHEGACSLEEIQGRTGLGSQCGQCIQSTCEVLIENAATAPQTTPRTPLPR